MFICMSFQLLYFLCHWWCNLVCHSLCFTKMVAWALFVKMLKSFLQNSIVFLYILQMACEIFYLLIYILMRVWAGLTVLVLRFPLLVLVICLTVLVLVLRFPEILPVHAKLLLLHCAKPTALPLVCCYTFAFREQWTELCSVYTASVISACWSLMHFNVEKTRSCNWYPWHHNIQRIVLNLFLLIHLTRKAPALPRLKVTCLFVSVNKESLLLLLLLQ